MRDIASILPGLPEIYQDVVVDGVPIAKGVRECDFRYGLIEPKLRGGDQVIIDIGSSLGYFSTRIAREHPSSLVVSFESVADHCEVQRQIAEREGLFNLVICHHQITKHDIRRWYECVECFDLVLLLSVLHHFPKHDAEYVFDTLLHMSRTIIAEYPNPGEQKVCGKETLDQLSHLMEYGKLLGLTRSHLDGLLRPMKLYNGGLKRGDLNAYMGAFHQGRKPHRADLTDEGWMINGKPPVKGINAWNLLHFNPVWPQPEWWAYHAVAAYKSLEKKSDVRPWNLLVTPGGMTAIDYTEFPEGSPEYFQEGDLEKLAAVFTAMKPSNPWRE